MEQSIKEMNAAVETMKARSNDVPDKPVWLSPVVEYLAKTAENATSIASALNDVKETTDELMGLLRAMSVYTDHVGKELSGCRGLGTYVLFNFGGATGATRTYVTHVDADVTCTNQLESVVFPPGYLQSDIDDIFLKKERKIYRITDDETFELWDEDDANDAEDAQDVQDVHSA